MVIDCNWFTSTRRCRVAFSPRFAFDCQFLLLLLLLLLLEDDDDDDDLLLTFTVNLAAISCRLPAPIFDIFQVKRRRRRVFDGELVTQKLVDKSRKREREEDDKHDEVEVDDGGGGGGRRGGRGGGGGGGGSENARFKLFCTWLLTCVVQRSLTIPFSPSSSPPPPPPAPPLGVFLLQRRQECNQLLDRFPLSSSFLFLHLCLFSLNYLIPSSILHFFFTLGGWDREGGGGFNWQIQRQLIPPPPERINQSGNSFRTQWLNSVIQLRHMTWNIDNRGGGGGGARAGWGGGKMINKMK